MSRLIGNSWQQYASAYIKEGACDECMSQLNCNVAMACMVKFIKHYQSGINPSVFQSPPTKLTQHISDTFILGELF